MAANANHWARVLVTATLLYFPFRRVLICICKLNSVGPELAERGLLKAAVDVTGFGLLGHLGVMCRASGVDAEVAVGAVPVIARNHLARWRPLSVHKLRATWLSGGRNCCRSRTSVPRTFRFGFAVSVRKESRLSGGFRRWRCMVAPVAPARRGGD